MVKAKEQGLRIWVIGEGLAGTENQCIGIAERLGVMPDIKRIKLKPLWQKLSPFIGGAGPWLFDAESLSAMSAPWPDIVLSSGRKAIAAARYIQKQSDGKTLIVQLQDPRLHHKSFDLIAVPHHDPYRGANAIVTHGAPNRITNEKLSAACAEWVLPEAIAKAKQKIAVMIGGKSYAYDFTDDDAMQLIKICDQLADDGMGVMLTASRRTGEKSLARFKEAFASRPEVYLWDGQGYNPYFAYLASADQIIVTADSVSMISEAASTGKPVYRYDLSGGNAKLQRFHDHMQSIGAVAKLDVKAPVLDFHPKLSLNDAEMVAEKIRALLAEKHR